jgi:hypothetical protein
MPPTKGWHEINRSFETVLILLKKHITDIPKPSS